MATQIISKPAFGGVPYDAGEAPDATAPFGAREEWRQSFAARFVALQPVEGTLPGDVRPSQRFENEFNYCDPQQYELQTRDELSEATKSPSK